VNAKRQLSGPGVFQSPEELLGAPGRHLGCTEWVVLDGGDVALFNLATGEANVDGEVPPLFVLSLTNRFLPDLLEVRGVLNGVNYGTGTVRFPATVRPGGRVRASARLIDAREVPGGVQTTVEVTIELEGSDSPACVVESLSRWMR
jgi:hypothetical protein